jgi:FAD/FMN-containing dehydrogenase
MQSASKSSRRDFVKGLLAGTGTLILGFDPVHRNWVTSARADSSVIAIPDLDGVLLTDPTAVAPYAGDFGHLIHRVPLAVLKPASVEDVAHAIKFCHENSIQVGVRGQGHSTRGQSLVQGGLVIDMATLKEVERIGPDHAKVQAGLRWKDLLAVSIPMGLTPPVLTGFVGLSIGGTLSMGGIGPASFLHGAQVNNVLELDVVTGKGDLVTCSAHEKGDLFRAVLGGVGQYGVIVRATLPLKSVPPSARNYAIAYVDTVPFFADLETLRSRGEVDGIYAQISPDGHGGWVYVLLANKFFAPSSPPNDAEILAGLHFPPPALQIQNFDTLSFDTFVDTQLAFLNSLGLLDALPHVWADVFVPSSKVSDVVQTTLAGLTPADLGPAGFVLLFPLRHVDESIAFRLPKADSVFLFDVLTSGSTTDPNYFSNEIPKARALFERARAVGGTLYPIGSTPMSKADWAEQYGLIYPELVKAKEKYDPNRIMNPGTGIF